MYIPQELGIHLPCSRPRMRGLLEPNLLLIAKQAYHPIPQTSAPRLSTEPSSATRSGDGQHRSAQEGIAEVVRLLKRRRYSQFGDYESKLEEIRGTQRLRNEDKFDAVRLCLQNTDNYYKQMKNCKEHKSLTQIKQIRRSLRPRLNEKQPKGFDLPSCWRKAQAKSEQKELSHSRQKLRVIEEQQREHERIQLIRHTNKQSTREGKAVKVPNFSSCLQKLRTKNSAKLISLNASLERKQDIHSASYSFKQPRTISDYFTPWEIHPSDHSLADLS